MKQKLVNAFLAPAQQIWESELKQPLDLIEARLSSEFAAPESVTAVIGVTGQIEGSVLYEFGGATGLAVASSMMGEPLQEHDEVSISALGELANMISGNAATKLSEQGIVCDITPPAINRDGAARFQGAQIVAAFTSGLGHFNIRIGLTEVA